MKKDRLSRAGWLALVAMLGTLAAVIVYAAHAWSAIGGVAMSGWGWTFLILAVVVTTGLGAGLMALVFYSNRNNYDR